MQVPLLILIPGHVDHVCVRLVQLLDNGLYALHVPYSYGFAIILLTVLVKALTFPLSRKQVRAAADL